MSGRAWAAAAIATLIASGLPSAQTDRAPTLRWTMTATGVTARLRGISAPSARVIWASGAGGTVIRSADGGATWGRLTVPGAAALDFRDIDAVDDRTAYILSIGEGEASRIYKTSDTGRTWQLQFTNQDPRAFFDAMAFRDARTGFAFSDSVDGRMILLTTTDGGAHWTPVQGLPPALSKEGAFAASGTNIAIVGPQVWIGTSLSRVLRSPDGGRTWSVAETKMPSSESAGIFSIAFADGRRGIAVGGDYKVEAGAQDNAAISNDGGATWTIVNGLGGLRSAVGFVPPLPATAIAVGPTGADYSTDAGRTWRPISGPGFHTLAVARGTRTVWAAGERGTVGTLEF